MDRVFKSKVGWWYHLLLIIMAAFCMVSVLGRNMWMTAVVFLLAALAVHVLLDTWYRITPDEVLIAHSSVFPEKKIAISEIESVEASAMPVSSYALSLDRIIIWADGKPWMRVSPKNKAEFVKLLQNINPRIIIRG